MLFEIAKVISKERIENAHESDFGFNNPLETIILCTTMLEVFNQLPEPGGVLDQDALLLDDILLYKSIRDSMRDENSDNETTTGSKAATTDNKIVKFSESVTEKNLFG